MKAKRVFSLFLCAVLVLGVAAGCVMSRPEPSVVPSASGETFTLQVVHGDGSQREVEVPADKETLGEALTDAGLIQGEDGPYGLFVKTVDGETADDAKLEWWRLTKGGESVPTGVDSTSVESGATYEFTLIAGY